MEIDYTANGRADVESETSEEYTEQTAQDMRYIKPGNESYHIRRQEPIDPIRRVPLWIVIPLILLAILGIYATFTSIGRESSGQTSYKVEGGVDYQVYLKENDFYPEKFLESGRQYIADLISAVRADFSYELVADDGLKAHYEYEILAVTKATDKSDKSKVLYERKDVLKTVKTTEISDGRFSINDNVNIDYAKYNDYLRSFRQEFGISANCFLDLKLVVKVDGAIKIEDTIVMNMPLSNQTVDITMDTGKISREGKIGEARTELYTKNPQMLVVGVVITVVSLAASAIIIYLHRTRFGNNWYAEALHKIFKNYDTRIVNLKESFIEPDDTVRVTDFIELIDASNTENSPILFCEVEPDYKAYFIVEGANITYRYTLSRAYQDELRHTKQKKEF